MNFKIGTFSILSFFLIAFWLSPKSMAQVPSAVCLGNCPIDNISPTGAGQNFEVTGAPSEIPATGNVISPIISAQVETAAPTTFPCQPVGNNTVQNNQSDVMHAKAKGHAKTRLNGGLLKKLLELLETMLDLLKQLLASAGIISPESASQSQTSNSANSAANTETADNAQIGGVANTADNNAAGGGAQTDPAVTLPPCPTGTEQVNPSGQTGASGSATPIQGNNPDASAAAQAEDKPNKDCDAELVPAQAKAFGLTRLAFCEDFSSKDTFDLDGKPVEGKTKFTQARAGNIHDSQPMPSSAFTWNADGTLTVNPTRNNTYPINAISSWSTNGQEKGFLVKSNTTGWYIEARVKHSNTNVDKGFFSFWTASSCKLYRGCADGIEMDFYQFAKGRVTHTLKADPIQGPEYDPAISICDVDPESDRTNFFTTGVLFAPGNELIRYYSNNKPSCEKTRDYFPAMSRMATQDFPIIFGAGTEMPYTIDFIRVWER